MEVNVVNTIKSLTMMELPIDQVIDSTQLRTQYRKLCLVYHPDSANKRYQDGKRFLELKVAYEYLEQNLDDVNYMIISKFRGSEEHTQSAYSKEKGKANTENPPPYEEPRANKFEDSKKSKSQAPFIAGIVVLIVAIVAMLSFNFRLSAQAPCNHEWLPATCTEPATCMLCGETQGIENGHQWELIGKIGPEKCKICGSMKPMNMPKSGAILLTKSRTSEATLKINCSDSKSYYIKLKNRNYQDYFAFFVKAGDTVTVDVPAGEFYVYFAYGDEWYGKEYLFGNDTQFFKDDELIDFRTHTLEYTLYPVTNGNFTGTIIEASEF